MFRGDIIFDTSERLRQLSSYTKEETWYIVKQEMVFWKVCYAVSILEEYQMLVEPEENLENYFKKRANEIKIEKGFEKFITTHRMLRQGYFFGLLIQSDNGQYRDAIITEVYKKIKKRCNGDFEKTEKYEDIIEQQIEKIYISSVLDEEYDGIRRRYRMFPIFTLYKILIEIGKITGSYEVSKDEYFAFVCTTERYSDYLDTVFNILNCRENSSYMDYMIEVSRQLKDGSRFHRLYQNLKTIEETSNGFKIKDDYIDYVNKKLYLFETSANKEIDSNYISILCSEKSLLDDKEKSNTEMKYMVNINDIPYNEITKAIPHNLIVYGAPGTGKSFKIEKEYRERYFKNEYLYSRVTFHPNYTYSDFVGVYKPTPIYIKKEEDKNEYYSSNKIDKLEKQMMPVIDYTFVPGPFLEILCKALNDSEHNYLLLIEEINRADVAKVFGDVFQLLDRVKEGESRGKSEYGIKFNKDIMNYISSKVEKESDCFIRNELVKIPSNMYIWATMNSADQNVKNMDAAFKRRWDFNYIGINSSEEVVNNVLIRFKFLEGDLYWNDFRHELNDFLSERLDIPEDRLIGPFFINDYKEMGTDGEKKKYITQDAIKYKLLSYIKDDVLRYNPTELFNSNYTLGKLFELYDKGNNIFIDTFTEKLKSKIIQEL